MSKSYLLLFGVGALWGVTPVFVRAAAADPASTAILRAFISGIILLLVQLRGRRKREHEQRNWIGLVLTGIAGCISTSSFAVGFLLTTPGNVYVLYYTFPIIVLIVRGLERKCLPSAPELVALLLGLAGLSVSLNDKIGIAKLGMGEVFGLVSSFAWVAHILFAQRLKSDSDAMLGNAIGQLLIAFVLSSFAFSSVSDLRIEQLVYLVSLGMTSAIALLLWCVAIRVVPGHIAGTITMLEAPIGIALIATVTGENITLHTALGGTMVLCSAGYLTTREK